MNKFWILFGLSLLLILTSLSMIAIILSIIFLILAIKKTKEDKEYKKWSEEYERKKQIKEQRLSAVLSGKKTPDSNFVDDIQGWLDDTKRDSEFKYKVVFQAKFPSTKEYLNETTDIINKGIRQIEPMLSKIERLQSAHRNNAYITTAISKCEATQQSLVDMLENVEKLLKAYPRG